MADTDLLTLDEARAAVNIDSADPTDPDAQLALYVTAITEAIDKRCGPVVVRDLATLADNTDTTVLALDAATTDAQLRQLWRRARAGAVLNVGTSALRRISAVDATALQVLVAGDPVTTAQDDTISEGRCADTDSVPAVFKLAAQVSLRHCWTVERGQRLVAGEPALALPFVIPYSALELLAGELVLGVG